MEIDCSPRVVWLAITDICNNKCLWCYEQGNRASSANTMGIEEAKLISNFMETVGVRKCIIIGGEPMLNPSFFDILLLLKEKGIKISMVTNGRRLSVPKNVRKINELALDGLTMSVHGWSSKTYKDLTQSANGFNEVVRAISLLQYFNVPFGLNFVLSRYTKGRIEEIADFIVSQNIRRVSFNLAAPAISKSGIDGSFVLPLKDYRKQVMDMYYRCKVHHIHAQFLLSIPHCIFKDEELLELFRNQSIICGCHLLRGNGIIFCADGSIALCNHLLDFKMDKRDVTEEVFRSKEKFLQLWNSGVFSRIRRNANCFRSDVCADCQHWMVCGGGCLVHWAYHNPLTVAYRKVDLGKEVISDGGTC